MNIFEHDGLFKASQISGPKHNYLGIAFSRVETIIELNEKEILSDKASVSFINGFELSKLVQEIVASEAEKQGYKLFISRLEFVPTDSPDFSIYAELAKAITAYAFEKLGQTSCV
jgi:hypothetical protein